MKRFWFWIMAAFVVCCLFIGMEVLAHSQTPEKPTTVWGDPPGTTHPAFTEGNATTTGGDVSLVVRAQSGGTSVPPVPSVRPVYSVYNAKVPVGSWLDITADSTSGGSSYFYLYGGSGTSKQLQFIEDYEVLRTHEICATLDGYFLEKSQLGRYTVMFHGMRTSAEFTFTTRYDAEHWVEKWCTPESLLSIKGGTGSMKRAY